MRRARRARPLAPGPAEPASGCADDARGCSLHVSELPGNEQACLAHTFLEVVTHRGAARSHDRGMPSITVSRSTALAIVSSLVAVLVLIGSRLADVGTARAPEPIAVPLEPVSGALSPQKVVVHVVGAVRTPGLLRLPEGARVADAVRRAGGATRRADLSGVNLAAPLVDGTQILVPVRVEGGSAGALASREEAGGAGAGRKPSLSSATADELESLPGVGPITAQKILFYRAEHGPFRTVDDLDAVPGIGPTRIEQLRDLVTP